MKTFGGKSLHHLDPNVLNPYQQVIQIIGETLSTVPARPPSNVALRQLTHSLP